ncbi:hypothetical protein Tco_0994459 [Tanacetum coccineum]
MILLLTCLFQNIPSTSQNVDELKTQQQHVQQQDNQVPLNPEIVVDSVLNAMLDENQFVKRTLPQKNIINKITHRQLEAGQLMASGERVGLTDKIRRLGWENLRVRALLCIKRDRVDSLCHHMVLLREEFHQIRRDRDDARRRLRRLESFVERRLGFRP